MWGVGQEGAHKGMVTINNDETSLGIENDVPIVLVDLYSLLIIDTNDKVKSWVIRILMLPFDWC